MRHQPTAQCSTTQLLACPLSWVVHLLRVVVQSAEVPTRWQPPDKLSRHTVQTSYVVVQPRTGTLPGVHHKPKAGGVMPTWCTLLPPVMVGASPALSRCRACSWQCQLIAHDTPSLFYAFQLWDLSPAVVRYCCFPPPPTFEAVGPIDPQPPLETHACPPPSWVCGGPPGLAHTLSWRHGQQAS
jgi:hypothetical protein